MGTVNQDNVSFLCDIYTYLIQNSPLQIVNNTLRKRAKIRNRLNQAPHLTQDTKWKSDNLTIRHHKQKPRGQPFWQAGDHKAQDIIKKEQYFVYERLYIWQIAYPLFMISISLLYTY